MPGDLNKPIRPGDPIKASIFEAMRKALLPLIKFSVEPPLELTQNAGSTNLRFATPLIRYAVTTSAISAKNTSTRTLGSGTAQIRDVAYNSSGVGTYASTGQSVTVYSGDATPAGVGSGRLIMIVNMDSKWHIVVDFCNQ